MSIFAYLQAQLRAKWPQSSGSFQSRRQWLKFGVLALSLGLLAMYLLPTATNPLTKQADVPVVLASMRDINIDGTISSGEWSNALIAREDVDDTNFGATNNLDYLYLTWDTMNLYIAVTGQFQNSSNNGFTIFLDSVYGDGNGIGKDGSNIFLLSDLNDSNRSLISAPSFGTTDSSFKPDCAISVFQATAPAPLYAFGNHGGGGGCANGNGGSNNSFSFIANLGSVGSTNTVYEVAIPWNSLYGNNVGVLDSGAKLGVAVGYGTTGGATADETLPTNGAGNGGIFSTVYVIDPDSNDDTFPDVGTLAGNNSLGTNSTASSSTPNNATTNTSAKTINADLEDWHLNEFIGRGTDSSNNPIDYHVTWDATNIYVAYSGAFDTTDNTDRVNIGIDVDPCTAGDTNMGVFSGVDFNNASEPDYVYQFRNNTLTKFAASGSGWSSGTSSGSAARSNPTTSPSIVEVSIPRSEIGSPLGAVSFYLWTSNNSSDQDFNVYQNTANTGSNQTLTNFVGWQNLSSGVNVNGSKTIASSTTGLCPPPTATSPAPTPAPSPTPVVVPVSGISGTVFRDYDADGVRDSAELGVAGVTVTAYNAAGTAVGTATTDANGNYTIVGDATDGPYVGQPYRIEFTEALSYLQDGAVGSNNGSSVQFITPSGLNTTGIGFGLQNPAQYCQNANSLNLATCRSFSGDNTNSGTSLMSYPYTSSGASPSVVAEAAANQMGSAYGIAYDRNNDDIFVSAFLKRHAALGSGGLGAIYKDSDANAAGGFSATAFATIPNVGTAPTGRDLGALTAPSRDLNAFNAVGRIGLGDLDISEDGTTLYAMNLNENKVYQVTVSSGAVSAGGATIPTPAACTTGFHAFGMGVNDGKLYAGGVCEEVDAGNDAFVYESSDGGATWNATPVLSFDLNYSRGCVKDRGGACKSAQWNSWTTVWPGWATVGGQYAVYPQAMLSDINFDNGKLIVSLRDRWGDQTGYAQYRANQTGETSNTDSVLYVSIVAGDILRADASGSSWTLASPGTEFYKGDAHVTSHDEIVTGGAVQVPGYPEVAVNVFDPIYSTNLDFLHDGGTIWLSNSSGNRVRETRLYNGRPGTNVHPPVADGELGKGNGLGDLEALCNPAPIEVGNRVWSDLDADGLQDANESAFSGVTVKLYEGDVACTGTGTLVATATTDTSGRYYFGASADGYNGLGSAYQNISTAEGDPVSGGLKRNTAYTVCIEAGQSVLGSSTVAPIDAADPLSTSDDLHDSDATDPDGSAATVNAKVAFTTSTNAGGNNHSYDFGFVPARVAIGNQVWSETDNNSTYNSGTDTARAGVKVDLFLDNGGTAGTFDATDTFVAQQTTDSNGRYFFNNVAPGDYFVRVASSNFAAGGPLSGLDTCATDEASGPNSNGDNNDNGTALGSNGSVANGIISVTVGSEPTTTDDDTGYTGGLPDADTNFTVDFCYKPGTVLNLGLGNLVWKDDGTGGGTVNDGKKNGTEPGVDNVTVLLYADEGTAAGTNGCLTAGDSFVSSTTTSGGGKYAFTNLVPGDYIVVVANSEFATGGDLLGYISTTGSTDPDTTVDVQGALGDDNGKDVSTYLTSGVCSDPITLSSSSEPTNGSGAGQDEAITGVTDNNANSTLDFGFYVPTMCLGNLVFEDLNNNGIKDGLDAGIGNVTLGLFQSDGTTQVTTSTVSTLTVTNATGVLAAGNTATSATGTAPVGSYAFCGLPAGNYVVKVLATNFVASGTLEGYFNSTGNGLTPTDPDDDLDSVDDGISDAVQSTRATAGIASGVITLSLGGEPTTDENVASHTSSIDNANDNSTVDFGFYKGLAVGNLVWSDSGVSGGTLNDGILNGTEAGIDGVDVQLVRDNGDGVCTTADTNLSTATTAGGGLYGFRDLPAGNYFVRIVATEFASSGTLAGYSSSNGSNGFNVTTDSVDRGLDDAAAATNGICSELIVLTVGDQNTADAGDDSGVAGTPVIPDNNANYLVDFGVVPPMDLGDAQDPGYKTLLSNTGAAHIITATNPRMGACVDGESDGQGNAPATGDDASDSTFDSGTCASNDDEDGLNVDGGAGTDMDNGGILLVPCETADIDFVNTNPSGTTANLNAWIDWAQNGDWADAGEQIFMQDTKTVAAGAAGVALNNQAFNVPCNVAPGDTTARFRLNTDTTIGATGVATNGEVEDYTVRLLGLDFGDAPDSYKTDVDAAADLVDAAATADAAIHGVAALSGQEVRLGGCVDMELGTAPTFGTGTGPNAAGVTAGALSDDGANSTADVGTCTNNDDEDGIMFDSPIFGNDQVGITSAPIQVGACETINIDVTGMLGTDLGAATGKLNAWIDWNANGTFEASEQIVDDNSKINQASGTALSFPANASTAGTISVQVPCNVTPGSSFYARFRFNTATGVEATGFTPTGEVEDYRITVLGYDFGDAPDTVNQTAGTTDAARHLVTGPRLGSCVDIELGANASTAPTTAGAATSPAEPTGDDGANSTAYVGTSCTGDDEDAFDPNTLGGGFIGEDGDWEDGGYIKITTSNITTDSCVHAWIDWDNDGFGTTDVGGGSGATADAYFKGTVTTGATTLTVSFPGDQTPDPTWFGNSAGAQAYLRLRIVNGACANIAPTGLQMSGEVEDYRLDFAPSDPTAVTLTKLQVINSARGILLAAVLASLAIGSGIALWVVRRKRANH